LNVRSLARPLIRRADVPAVILGGGISALAVLRALGIRGVPTFLLGSAGEVAARSRFAARLSGGDVAATATSLLAALRSSGIEEAVLFPCSDDWLHAVAALPPEARHAFPSPIATPDVVATLTRKDLFARAAALYDVPHPRTTEVRCSDDLARVSDHELSSSFLKPSDSQAFSRRFRTKGFRVADRDQAGELLRGATAAGLGLVLQEFIPADPSAHIFLDGFVDRDGRIRGLLARQRLRMFPPGLGNSTDSVTVPLAGVTPAIDALRRLFRGLGYRGLFDAEFVRDDRDGVFRVIEVNARPWWQLELAAAAGLDLVGMAYDDALGRAVREAAGYRIGARWINPIQDVRSRLAHEAIAIAPLCRRDPWLRARHAAFRWNDPAPGFAELSRLLRAVAKRGHRRRQR
jgi:predicted ATP-grasp superfamily ATP-dependent carboligase